MRLTDNKLTELSVPFSIRLACILFAIGLIITGLYVLQDVIVPVVFSIIIAILLYPVNRRLERWGVSRVVSIVLCIILLIGVLILLFYLVSLQIAAFTDEAPRLIERGNQILDKLRDFAERTLNINKSRQVTEARKYMGQVLQSGGVILTTTLLATTNTLSTISLVPLYVFFLLLYRDFFRAFLYKLFASTKKAKLNIVFFRIYDIVRDYMIGLVSVIFIVGVLNTVGLIILKVEYAVFFGFFGAVMILIPYIGILIGSVLPTLYTLMTHDNPLVALGVLGVFLFVQVLEGNFITPYIVGSKVSVNPLAAIIVLLLWGQLWGISGLILALPLTAIIKVIFDAVEPLRPFGFLLGEAERPRTVTVSVDEIKRKLPQQVKKFIPERKSERVKE